MQKLHENSKYAPMNESQYEWIYNQELHWQNYCIVQFFFIPNVLNVYCHTNVAIHFQ